MILQSASKIKLPLSQASEIYSLPSAAKGIKEGAFVFGTPSSGGLPSGAGAEGRGGSLSPAAPDAQQPPHREQGRLLGPIPLSEGTRVLRKLLCAEIFKSHCHS